MASLTSVGGAVVGVGVGEAAATAIEPALEPQRQAALAAAHAVVLDLGTLARLVSQGLISLDAAEAEALRSGYTQGRVERAIQLELKAAPVAELLELWRRGKITEALVDHGLAKAQIEPQYWTAIKELFFGRLDPAIIATAIQRGIMTDPGFLPVGPPTAEGNVKAFPVSTLDPLAEAQAMGIDKDRLFVETAIVGLPLALVEAAQGYYRGVLTLDDFKRAVAEGNTRNEWGDAALEVSRQILTSGEYTELELRGFSTRDQRLADTAKHGMSAADSDKLYDVLGRAPSIHTVVIGLARGGVYPGSYANVPEPYRSEIQRSNIREEWAEIVYAARYSYPTPFVLRTLAEAGQLGDTAAVEQLLLEIGWKPELAAHVAGEWVPTGAGVDANLKKAHTTAWSKAQASYVAEESTAADVQPIFTTLGIDPTVAGEIVSVWDEIRALVRKQLSPAQIKKAYTSQTLNPATGVAWSQADAIAALLARGYDQADAQTLLAE